MSWEEVPTPDRVSSGDEFWARRLSARDPGKIGAQSSAGGSGVRHAASFGTKSQILSGTRCVSGRPGGRGLDLGGFTQDPRRILGSAKKGRFDPRVEAWREEVPTPGLSFSQTRSEFWDKISDFVWDSLRVEVRSTLACARVDFYQDPVLN